MFQRLMACLLLTIPTSLMADGDVLVSHARIPVPSGTHVSPPNGELVWNRLATDNFLIYSLSADQGRWLFENIEDIRSWCLSRWGLPVGDVEQPFVVVCVNTPERLGEYFGLRGAHGEIQGEGDDRRGVLWLSLHKPPAQIMPIALTTVCMQDVSKEVPFWAIRGTALLNSTIPQVRSTLAGLTEESLYRTEFIEKTTESQYRKMNDKSRRLFDRESCYLVLMIRREFGQRAFHNIVSGKSLLEVTQFETTESLDQAFGSYVINLRNDVASNRMPDSYLQIEPPKE